MTDRAELIRILREPFDRNPYTLPELCAVTADLLEADHAEIARWQAHNRKFVEEYDALKSHCAELEALVNEPIKLHHAGRLYSMIDLIDWFSEWIKRAECLLLSSEKQS